MISNDTYGILHRLLLNEQIQPSPEGMMRMLGFVHVYSASGLHLLALESFLLKNFAKTRLMKKILTVFFWFFLIMIWKLQGFRLGFARVLVLFFLRSMAKVKGLRFRVFYPLFIAFCFDFATGIDSGWQHYYLAILGGMLGLELSKRHGIFLQHCYLAVGSWLMTAPLDLLHHHLISWMTPVWSMITIPVIAVFLYPSSVICFFVLDRIPDILMNVWNVGVELLLKLVDLEFTFSVVNEQGLKISLLFSIVMSLSFIVIRKLKYRIILFSLTLLVSLVFKFHPNFILNELKLIQMDVGQGDALLIENHDRIEMIDLGTSRNQKTESMILHLSKYGVNHIDTVLFSHLDEDHAGGLRNLLPWIPIASIEVNHRLARTQKVKTWLKDFPLTHWCEIGCFKTGRVDWIGSGHRFNDEVKGNELMATTIIPVSDKEVYLALGDSDSRQEALFWDRHSEEIRHFPIRILKVSHHGSKNSSELDFFLKVNPSLAVISVGKHNHYHHPHYSVLQKLKLENVPIHRTDINGDYSL